MLGPKESLSLRLVQTDANMKSKDSGSMHRASQLQGSQDLSTERAKWT